MNFNYLFCNKKKENDLNNISQKGRLHRPNRWGTVLDELRNAPHPGHLIIIHHYINDTPSIQSHQRPFDLQSVVSESRLFTNQRIIYHQTKKSTFKPS
jgi:hypothetical protein